MSVFDIFRSPAPAPAPSPSATAAATGAPGQSQTSNPTVPSSATQQSDGTMPAIPAAAEGDKSPLDSYSKLWEAKDTSSTRADLVPVINTDPAALMQGARNIDFTKAMDGTKVEAAMKGDKAAFMEVINSAAQAGYAQSAATTVAVVKEALRQQAEGFETKYAPDMLRRQSVQSQISSSVQIANDPAVAPMMALVTKQLMAQFPTASAEEIAAHANKYLDGVAQAVVASQGGKIQTAEQLKPPLGSTTRVDTDWEKFFELDTMGTQR